MVNLDRNLSRKIARDFGIPEPKVREMAQAEILDLEKAANNNRIPDGGIRFKDACAEFDILPGTLSGAVKQGVVEIMERRSWKYLILVRTSVEDYAKLLKRFPRPGPRPNVPED